MSNFPKLLLISSCLFLLTGHAEAAKSEKKAVEKELKASSGALNIVAVVGEQAISSFDLESRLKFIVLTTRISNSAEVIAGIKPQVLKTLIDESLQLQEAVRHNIIVDEKEVTQAIAGIEAQRGMPAGEIQRMLAANNIPMKTYTDQVRSQLSWGKLLGKKVRGKIKISDSETTMAHSYIRPEEEVKTEAPVNVKEVEIAVINLPIESKKQIPEVKKLVERLYGELRKGASFEDVARQFSASGDAKPFWIRPQQLEANVAQAIINTKEGAITPPVPTRDGFSIIKVVRVRADKPKADAKPQKKEAKSSLNDEQIRDSLFRQKFEVEAQKYLRDLRRETFIEVRG